MAFPAFRIHEENPKPIYLKNLNQLQKAFTESINDMGTVPWNRKK
ncbi:MAG: hypothetical protein RI983_2035 [Bacteroidota bacterium]|jgi:hypothetical protein